MRRQESRTEYVSYEPRETEHGNYKQVSILE